MKLEREKNVPRIFFISVVVFGVGFLFLFPVNWLYVIGWLHYTDELLYPFLDMHGRLAAFEGHRAGIDILYQPNPYDPMGRVNVKPTWPLGLSFLGLGPKHLILAGTTAIVVFGAIVFSILKPRKWVDALILVPICFSPPILLGVERANDDLVYFSLLALVPLALKLKTPMRFGLAWVVIFMLAPAKYYPGAVFAVFFLEVKHWRQLGLLFAAGVLFVGGYLAANMTEVLYLREAVPKPNVFLVHGGRLAFEALGMPGYWAVALTLLCVGMGVWVILRRDWGTLPVSLGAQRWFVLGYAVLTFCFLLNSNYDYRLIFALPLLPLLMEVSRMDAPGAGWQRVVRVMVLLLIPIFWIDLAVVHYFVINGSLAIEHIRLATALKSGLLWIFIFGATWMTATLVRPNVRALAGTLSADFSQFRMK